MRTLEAIVADLEYCKELKELGVKQESLFYGVFYCIPYLVRKAWGDAENRTKKACDVCFRDIDKFNKYAKENNL